MKDYNDFYEHQNTNDPYAAMSEPKAKKSGAGKIVAIALCCSLLGGAAGAGGAVLATRTKDAPAVSTSTQADAETSKKTLTAGNNAAADGETGKTETESKGSATLVNGTHSSSVNSSADSSSQGAITQTVADTGKKMTASEVYKANVNSTVGIKTSITSTNYWGYRTQAAASGSGFIISADGYILTNHHVIEDADSITVTLYDGRSFDAKLVGSDESNDVAVLKVEAEGLTPAVLGSSGALEVGEDVVAIGNPLGELTFSLTAGIVSALDRTITTESTTMDLIQTDCAINAGNSGGALFNDRGEVVGITNAKLSAGMSETSIDNIGFAIPINRAMRIAQSILSDGSYEKPYLGVTVRPAEADEASGSPAGAEIVSVTDGSPAAAAGLQAGDIVTAANGKAVDSGTSLVLRVADCAAGEQLTLTVWRGGKLQDVTVTLAARPQDNAWSEPFRNH